MTAMTEPGAAAAANVFFRVPYPRNAKMRGWFSYHQHLGVFCFLYLAQEHTQRSAPQQDRRGKDEPESSWIGKDLARMFSRAAFGAVRAARAAPLVRGKRFSVCVRGHENSPGKGGKQSLGWGVVKTCVRLCLSGAQGLPCA